MTRKARFASAAALVVSAAFSARAADAPAPAPAAEKGDLWEVTTQMSMEGVPMAMPGRTVKMCTPKTWTEPPAPENQQQQCTNSDFHTDGAKSTWKITCGPPHPMTGTGEITRNGDAAYSGAMKFAFAEGNMTMSLDGRRVGDCDVTKK